MLTFRFVKYGAVALILFGACLLATPASRAASDHSQSALAAALDSDALAARFYVYYKGPNDRAWIFDSDQPTDAHAQQRADYLRARGYQARYVQVGRFSDKEAQSETTSVALAARFYVYYKGPNDRAWIFDSDQPTDAHAQQRADYLRARGYQARYVQVGR
jgi:hypothetical protein